MHIPNDVLFCFPLRINDRFGAGFLLAFWGGLEGNFWGFFAAFVMFAFDEKNTDFVDETLTISLRKTGLAA